MFYVGIVYTRSSFSVLNLDFFNVIVLCIQIRVYCFQNTAWETCDLLLDMTLYPISLCIVDHTQSGDPTRRKGVQSTRNLLRIDPC